MKERNKAVPAVYLVLEKEKKILLMRRANTGYQDGNYALPAGHVEAGELPRAALVREVKEELGITVDENDLVFLHVSYRPKHDETGDRVDLFFGAKQWTGEIVNAEPGKCDDLQWFDPDNLPENMMPHARDAIEKIQKGSIYSELGTDFLRRNGLYMLD